MNNNKAQNTPTPPYFAFAIFYFYFGLLRYNCCLYKFASSKGKYYDY
ncbi:hypothetical protein BROOK1789B_199 [Bathymodiolus brooksi thiotrophic gill symbiont]|nr:hypothetical protein BROOK1789B_199 [Bathymodiolus brooksi thiotrophic gill symbiont]